LSRRFRDYFNVKYLARSGRKMIIYNALLKNGYSLFKLEILEYCELADVIEREQYYIDLLCPEYNLNQIAGSRFGSKHSEETRQKMSENRKGGKNPMYGVLGENSPRFGLKHSEETLNKLRDRKHSEETKAKLRDMKHSEETKARISKAAVGNTGPPAQTQNTSS